MLYNGQSFCIYLCPCCCIIPAILVLIVSFGVIVGLYVMSALVLLFFGFWHCCCIVSSFVLSSFLRRLILGVVWARQIFCLQCYDNILASTNYFAKNVDWKVYPFNRFHNFHPSSCKCTVISKLQIWGERGELMLLRRQSLLTEG